VVRRAYAEMRRAVEQRIGGTIADANDIVANALDIRNSAIYGLGNYIRKEAEDPVEPDGDLAIIGALPKAAFDAVH
jgi:hypothetical protein